MILFSNVSLSVVTGQRMGYRCLTTRCFFTFPNVRRQLVQGRAVVNHQFHTTCSVRDEEMGYLRRSKVIVAEKNKIIEPPQITESKVVSKFKPVTNFGKVASRGVRRFVGSIFSTVGLLTSAGMALITDKDHFRRLKPTVKSLRSFLETSGIALELKESLNRRLFQNLIILARVQQESMSGADRRKFAAYPPEKVQNIPTSEESLRYAHVFGSERVVVKTLFS